MIAVGPIGKGNNQFSGKNLGPWGGKEKDETCM